MANGGVVMSLVIRADVEQLQECTSEMSLEDLHRMLAQQLLPGLRAQHVSGCSMQSELHDGKTSTT
jgi:hypothetical protein